MTLSERGSRRKRIWVETQTHLGRGTPVPAPTFANKS